MMVRKYVQITGRMFNNMCFSIAITVQFTRPLYIVAEESRLAQPELIFSNPSYTDINVTILNTEIDATG